MDSSFETLFESSSELELDEWQQTQLANVTSVSEAECLLQIWFNFTHRENSQGVFCNATWDNVYCWPPAPAGTVVTRLCSEVFHQAYSHFSIQLKGRASRVCLDDGTWALGKKSNYDECTESLMSYLKEVEEDDALLVYVQYMLFIGSILSLLCLGMSLAIFYYFRCLRCDRVTVQTHLMVSLVLRFITMFIIAEPHILGHASGYADVDILCEFILVSYLYATFSSVSWMFIQGLYLNMTLTTSVNSNITRHHLLIYYTIGWAVPAIFIFAFVVAMMLKEQERCWNGYSEMKEMWILLCPILFEVVGNGIFLMNILRILMRKVRNSRSRPDSSQIKAAAKATVILFPVLGVNNLFLLYNPGGEYNKYFVALNTFFGSTQGIFVAIVYCFTNKEVRSAISRSIERVKARRMDNRRRIQGAGVLPDGHRPQNIMMNLISRSQRDSFAANSVEQGL